MKKDICKKIISLALAVVFSVSATSFLNEKAYAEIKDTILEAGAMISNVGLLNPLADCEHDYYVSNQSIATCIRKAYITYTCSLCGATKREYSALGHFYTVTKAAWRQASYSCDKCTSTVTKSVDYLLQNFSTYINAPLVRTVQNDSCYFDINNDGYINAKDFAKIRKLDKYELTNKNADATTKRIYDYLCHVNGNNTISAQQESTWMGSPDYEINHVYNNSDKYPAMRGLDYMNDDFYGVNSRAKQWWQRGGLVTICWHTGSDFTGEWNDAMNDEVEDWSAMLTPGTTQYNQMISGMDKAANALKDLQNAGVTVLWRPFHEFDGAWFWWGKGGSANFIKLWQIMYDRYTNYWGLNNLIWVLGYSHNGTGMANWNPGDEYYDIMGADSYTKSEFSGLYTKVRNLCPAGKPICLHECGTNPTPAELEKMPWCYFMTWHTTYITNDNTADNIRELYNSDKVITLDELSY